jgi:outer membrane lipoprotein-sorting protein
MLISRQLERHPWTRWAVPIGVTVVAVGATALFAQTSASADAPLPPRSAAQLLVDVQSSGDIIGSGTVVQKADLGLPQLPTMSGGGSSNLASLISGNHTLRVWSGGDTKTRVALMGTLGESDVIRNGRDLWTWSSDSNSATHRRLPASMGAKAPADAASDLGGTALTPQQVAQKSLAALDDTTGVRTDGTAQVAGRSAYELVLSPKDTSSLVGQIRIAVDAEKHIPLRVQIYAKNATVAAFEAGFTQINFSRPSDAQFRFTPPPGVKLTEETAPLPDADTTKSAVDAAASDADAPVATGKGWTTVLQAQLPAEGTDQLNGKGTGAESLASLQPILQALPRQSGSWGTGRLLHSSLFNVLLTDKGRILAGAVSAERLYELAAQPLPTRSAPAK